MKYFVEGSTLSEIGNAIREKTGEEGLIPLTEFASKISDISGGGGGAQFFYQSFTTAGNAGNVQTFEWLKDALGGRQITGIKGVFLLSDVTKTPAGFINYSAFPDTAFPERYYLVNLVANTSSSSTVRPVTYTIQTAFANIFSGEVDPATKVRISTYYNAVPISVGSDGTIACITGSSTSSSSLGLFTSATYHLIIVYETN